MQERERQEEARDVIIAGGGFAGLALAVALAQSFGAGGRIAVLDPAFGRAPRKDPNSSAVAAGPRRLLETLGLWHKLSPQAAPVMRMSITDSRLEDVLRPVWLDFGGPLPDGEAFAHIVPNDVLRDILLKAAQEQGVELLPAGFAGYSSVPMGLEVTLSDGRLLRAPLLVAADGQRSRVRDAARIRTHGWRYDQAAIVTRIQLAADHEGTAIQHFLPGGPLALLPLPERHAAVVWTLPRMEAERLAGQDDITFRDALEQAAGHAFDGLSLAGPRAVRPLGLQVARSFVAPRVALIGDAAHAIHPLAGQGLNLALKDVAALVEVVVGTARLGGDIGGPEPLERYARWRRFDSLAMVAATDALAHLFRNNRLRTVRDVGLGAFDRLGRLKNSVIRAAAGVQGDAPALLRGERP
ncbi:2-octaprenyl-6-methoxyphenyl hydroxylase [Agaricicola taiwanensis]|uniref:2-octaprenyl-6-methoxyphenyl hydroxylase n=1 Tax=Agaricicola taiwanensis TaxID=591372 RepID=A0A8J2YBR1_9RHOB|nr:FAD-dependent monooxygenase [Agaricicola taiwanensis]GGE28662.1 2-octaprenyl-6-methoxyphenyl hydroxylase [Agaricicola taiwanensis]